MCCFVINEVNLCYPNIGDVAPRAYTVTTSCALQRHCYSYVGPEDSRPLSPRPTNVSPKRVNIHELVG